MLQKLRETFKSEIANKLPGDLAVFNFADTKRRNDHMGHIEVDKEIEEFTRSLSQAVGSNGFSMRIGGARWLGFFPPNSIERMSDLLKNFYKEQTFVVGWRSQGRRDTNEKSHTEVVESKIMRAMLCIYSRIDNLGHFDTTIEQLLDNDYGLSFSIPHELKQIQGTPRNRWQCVSHYPAGRLACPFCHDTSFNWIDGDSSVYSGYGFCKSCGAEVSFSTVAKMQ